MQADHRQYTTLGRRKAIDMLRQLADKVTTGRRKKAVRRSIATLLAEQMAVFHKPQSGIAIRRLKNSIAREQRHEKIVARRAAKAAFKASKPVFEE